MMRALLLGASACASLAGAVTVTQVSTEANVQCSTAYGSGGVAPTPIPTSDITKTTSTVITAPVTTIPSGYTRITDSVVTTTQHTSLVVSITFATVTSGIVTSGVNRVTTIATALWPVTTCTNNVTPTTVTKYTGTYTPVSGQATALPKSYPTEIFCTTSLTSHVTLLPTETSGLGTLHTTPTSTIIDYTTTSTSTLTYLTVTTPSATVTSTYYSYVEAGHAEPTRIACEETVTKTLDARCAPTNLISDHNGVGLVSGRYNTNVTVVYTRDEPYGSDASACCQLCLDNEGCGASMWGPYETCGLYYHGNDSGEPQCDFIFTYGTEEGIIAGQGIVVSNGCGTVEYE
ncbi:hypothetical protein F5Y07DRAFT_355067 [Xylaria sp. FL0933]|nr:hypothetical protein F5Y07DRAFT_355067 [Xylaria sp. FL0933]